jgi:hypothetical protein
MLTVKYFIWINFSTKYLQEKNINLRNKHRKQNKSTSDKCN